MLQVELTSLLEQGNYQGGETRHKGAAGGAYLSPEQGNYQGGVTRRKGAADGP